MTKYHSGPPPSIGWWPTRIGKSCREYRWWDGKRWSWPAFPHENEFRAARWAAKKEVNKIEECHCLTPAGCPSPNICFEDCLVLGCLVALFIAIGAFAWL